MDGVAEAFGQQLYMQDADGRSFVVLNRHNRSVTQPYGGPEMTLVEHHNVFSARGGPPRRHGSHTDLRGAPQYHHHQARGGPPPQQRAPSPLLNYQLHPELLRPYQPHNNQLHLEHHHGPHTAAQPYTDPYPHHHQLPHAPAHHPHHPHQPHHHHLHLRQPPLPTSVSEPLDLTPPPSPAAGPSYSLVVRKARIPLPLASLHLRNPTEVKGHAQSLSHEGVTTTAADAAPTDPPQGVANQDVQEAHASHAGALMGDGEEGVAAQRLGRVGHRSRMGIDEKRRSRSADNLHGPSEASPDSREVSVDAGGGAVSAPTSPKGEGPATTGEGPHTAKIPLKVEKADRQVTPDLLRDQKQRQASSKAPPVTEETARHALFTYLKHTTTDSVEVIQRKVKMLFEKIQWLRSCSAEALEEKEEQRRKMQEREEKIRRKEKEEEKRRRQEKEGQRRRLQEELRRCEEAQQKLRQQLTHKEKDLQTALQQLQQVKQDREKFSSEIRDLQEQLSSMHDELDRVTHEDTGDRRGIMQDLVKLRQEFEEVLVSQEAQEEVLRRKERELTALRGALEEEVAAHAEEVTNLRDAQEQEMHQLQQRLARETQGPQQEQVLLGRVQELEERVSHLTHLLQEAQRREKQLQEHTHTLTDEKEKLESCLEEVKQQEEALCRANQALTRHLEDTQSELSMLQQEQRELRRRLQEQGGAAEQLRRERSSMEEQRRQQDRLMEQLQEEMLRVVQEAEHSTQRLQEQVEAARGSSEGELGHLLNQLHERQQEILTSTQHNQRLHKELSQLEAELHQCEAELEGAGLRSRKLEQQLAELQQDKRGSQEDRGRITRLLEGRVSQLEADLREERTNEEQLLQRLERGREQTEQARAELLQEKAARQDLECDKISLERQNRDLRSRVTHLEGGQRTGQDGLVSRLEARIQELETRLEGEERESTNLQQANRKLERKLKELVVQIGEEQLSLKDQRDQLTLRLKTLKRQLDEAEGEIERLEGGKRKIQRELDEQLEANQQLHTHITQLRADVSRKRRAAPFIATLEDDEEEEAEEDKEQKQEEEDQGTLD